MSFFSLKKQKKDLFLSYAPQPKSLNYLAQELNKEIKEIEKIKDNSSLQGNQKDYLTTLHTQALRFNDRMTHSRALDFEEKETWLLIAITTLRLVRKLDEPFMESGALRSNCVESLNLLNTPNDYYETKIAQLAFSVIGFVSVMILIPSMGFPPVFAACFALAVTAAWIALICDLQKQSKKSYDIIKPITKAALNYGEEVLSLEKKPNVDEHEATTLSS